MLKRALIPLSLLVVLSVLVWQAVAMNGSPNPLGQNLSPAATMLATGVLVFREGLEAILVLAAITAGMARGSQKAYLRAIPVGALAAFVATLATWFGVVAIISRVNLPELYVQAATGLLAIAVLLVVMNWFFHKFYWTGWISHHNERKRRLLDTASDTDPFWGLALLGFTAIYREGFEIVLFLQNLRLRAGNTIVLEGTILGLSLTLLVAALTFVAHQRLPYKKMLIWTGILLGGVLLVMVGESVQEMQQCGWIATTSIGVAFPGWLGLWFSVFPNVQGLVAQGLAAFLVIGSYLSAQYLRVWRRFRKSDERTDLQADRRVSDVPHRRTRPGVTDCATTLG